MCGSSIRVSRGAGRLAGINIKVSFIADDGGIVGHYSENNRHHGESMDDLTKFAPKFARYEALMDVVRNRLTSRSALPSRASMSK